MRANKRTDSVRLERCPGYRDPEVLMEHVVAAALRLSRSGDPAVASKACQWLVAHAEGLMNRKSQAKEEAASAVSPDGVPQGRVC